MKQGYLGIFRKFFDHEFWKEKRQYSKAEAWIDLMQCARYGENPETLLDKRGSYILEYGDVYISSRYLGERWQWSRTKVSSFLNYLEKRESITYRKKDSHRTIINITNLKGYTNWIQGKREEKASDQTSEKPVKGQSSDSEKPKKKKVNKEKKVNSKTEAPESLTPEDNLLKFFEKESYWKENYTDLIDACLDHFRAKGEKKVDWEATVRSWCRNDKKWNPNNYDSTNDDYVTMTGVNGEDVKLYNPEEIEAHRLLLSEAASKPKD